MLLAWALPHGGPASFSVAPTNDPITASGYFRGWGMGLFQSLKCNLRTQKQVGRQEEQALGLVSVSVS